MRPKNRADYRTLLWVLLAPTVVGVQYARPDLVPYLAGLSCYFALACGVIAHNHNHCPTFANKRANFIFSNWISIFYGYPTFAWVPTHNLNHHKYVNTAGDATITWRYTNKHHALIAFVYPFVSSYWQSGPISAYIKKAKEIRPEIHRRIMIQYFVWGGAYVTLLALAVLLHGVSTGLYVFGLSVALPAIFALWTIMLFNYEQHVHANPFSPYDHSRSFTSPTLNFLLFNNGYHYVHHEHPAAHWSTLPALHAEVEDKIDPRLVHKSVWWYWFKQYVLAPFFPKLGTVQLGPGPMNPPDGSDADPRTADVALADAGTTAAPLRV